MPKLGDDATTDVVNCIGDVSPSSDLFFAPEAGCVGPSEALGADCGGLGNDEAGAGSLDVVLRLERGWNVIVRVGAHSRKRRHDDAVAQAEISHAERSKKRLRRWDSVGDFAGDSR